MTKAKSLLKYVNFFLRSFAISGCVNWKVFEKCFTQNVLLDTKNAFVTEPVKSFRAEPKVF